MQLERAKEMDTDLMEISAHEGARPTHTIWQGKIDGAQASFMYKSQSTASIFHQKSKAPVWSLTFAVA